MTVLLTIAGVVSVMAILNTVFPFIARSSGAVISVTAKIDDRIKTQIRIVHTTGELDENQKWQDTDSDGDFDICLWVKNVCASRLVSLKESDVFFGTEGDFARIPHEDDAAGAFPRWEFSIENATEWKSTATLKITIHYDDTPCDTGPHTTGCTATNLTDTYFVKVAAPNGVSDDHFFSF